MGLWGFLSICVICGVGFSVYGLYLDHKRKMKEMELEALKHQGKSLDDKSES